MSRSALLWCLLAASLLVGLGRLTVPGHDLTGWPGLYEALAHVWVGVLLTLGVLPTGVRGPAWIALGVLTAFETVMFLLR